jgi:hypothetical protein
MYNNDSGLFLDPKVSQHGSNMVMTNVSKPIKTKFLNIDTNFSEDLVHNNTNYNKTDIFSFTIPEKITDVKTIKVANAEIPYSFYSIATSLGNNFFKVTTFSDNTEDIITIDDGEYTPTTLIAAINAALINIGVSIIATNVNGHTVFTNTHSTATYTIQFDINTHGINDKYMFKSKLGWILGFRVQSTELTPYNDVVRSNSIIDTNTINYLYLIVDEYTSIFTNTFISPQSGCFMNKKILAKITIDKNNYSFGDVIHASAQFGTLLTDTRTYIGKTDLQKLSIQLVNRFGTPIILNGLDFSFTLQITHD